MIEIVCRPMGRHITRSAGGFDDCQHALPRRPLYRQSAGPKPLAWGPYAHSRSRSFNAGNKKLDQRVDCINRIEHTECEIEVRSLSKRLPDELAMLLFPIVTVGLKTIDHLEA